MISRLRSVALALALAAPACGHTLDVEHRPKPSALPAAGLQRLVFLVEVEDVRAGDPRELGSGAGGFPSGGSLSLSRNAADVVRDAVQNQLRSHDLRVVDDPARANARLRISLDHVYCCSQVGDGLRATLEGEVTVVDRAGRGRGPTVIVSRIGRPVSGFTSGRTYQRAFEAALGDFAARAVRHPDVLIALQQVAAQISAE